MNSHDKYNRLMEIQDLSTISKQSLRIIRHCSRDHSELIRSKAADLLIDYQEFKVDELLYHLAKDRSPLVRASACDALSTSNSISTIAVLKKLIGRDKSGVVRAYAVFALGDILIRKPSDYTEVIGFLSDNLSKENKIATKIAYYKVLYMLGKTEFLELLLRGLDGIDYHNRCAVANSLINIINPNNAEMIKIAVHNRINIEPYRSVRSLLEKLREILNGSSGKLSFNHPS